MEDDEQQKLFQKLEKLEQTTNERGNKHQEYLNNKKLQAKEYTDHILERLELLKIQEIVFKIENENRYLQKVEKIEKVRNDKQTKDKEVLDLQKTQKGKWYDRTMNNK